MITVGRKLSLSATLSFSLHQSKHICPPSEKFNVSLKKDRVLVYEVNLQPRHNKAYRVSLMDGQA